MKPPLTIFLLLSIAVIFSSCDSNEDIVTNTVEYCYADNSIISERSITNQLKKELSRLDIDEDADLKVYSTLRPVSEFKPFSDSLQNLYIESIRNNDPRESFLLDSISHNRFYDIGFVVYENATGNTIYRYEPSIEYHSLDNMMGYGKSSRILGFFLTMYKGQGVEDEYQAFTQWEDSVKLYNEKNEVVDYWYNDGKKPLKELFYLESGGEIPKFPYRHYEYADWKEIGSKLKINLDVECGTSSIGCLIQTNFTDLVETLMLVRNSGQKKNTSLISKIVDSNGKILYRKKLQSELTVSKNTIDKMRVLFENNMENGMGQFLKKELSLDSNYHAYWGRNRRDIGWLLLSEKDFTIGIIIKGTDNLGHNGMAHYLSPHYTQKRPKILLPIIEKILSISN